MRLEECFRPIAKKERLILVEGRNDALLVGEMCKEERLTDSVQILCYSQVGKLGGYLDVLVRDSGFELVKRIGLTRDADVGAERAIQSLKGAWTRALAALKSIGREVPECLFFAIPDNQNLGRLENLCLLSAKFPGILECAEQMYECAKRVASHEIDREKSIVAAYLSMMERPGLQLGTGAQAGCWDLRSAAFVSLRDFVLSIGSQTGG